MDAIVLMAMGGWVVGQEVFEQRSLRVLRGRDPIRSLRSCLEAGVSMCMNERGVGGVEKTEILRN